MDLQGELNRLASLDGAGAALAARTYAECPYDYDVVGALNYLAFAEPGDEHRELWLDLQGVCNELAGTSGLGAPEALSRIP
jgi:hypothetical protein